MLKIGALAPDLVIHSTPDRVVVSAEIQRRVDAIWAAEQARRSRPMHDGELFSLTTREPARWTGAFVPYRRFVAQLVAPDLFEHLQVRPVAVSGVLIGPDGVVFGRRADDVTQSAGRWELAPSGGLDRTCLLANGTLDYLGKIIEELQEETGCKASQLTGIRTFAAVEDGASRCIDIGVELSTKLTRLEIQRMFRSHAGLEYGKIEVIKLVEIADFVGRHDDELVQVSSGLLLQLGLLTAESLEGGFESNAL